MAVVHPDGRQTKQTALIVLPALASMTLLSGCAGGVTLHDSGAVTVISDAGFLTGDEALVTGTVTVTDGGCVGIVGAGGESYPVIWPRGTGLDNSSPVTIDVPGLGTLNAGDAIEGAGGYYNPDNREQLREVATRCQRDGEIAGVRFE